MSFFVCLFSFDCLFVVVCLFCFFVVFYSLPTFILRFSTIAGPCRKKSLNSSNVMATSSSFCSCSNDDDKTSVVATIKKTSSAFDVMMRWSEQRDNFMMKLILFLLNEHSVWNVVTGDVKMNLEYQSDVYNHNRGMKK